MGRTKEKLKRKRRRLIKAWIYRIGIPLVFVLVVIYIAGAIYSVKHFYGRDTVFGVKIARQTVEEVKEQVAEKVKDYQIVIQGRTGEEIITAQEVGLQFVADGMVEELLKKQPAPLWFTGIFGKAEDIPIPMAYDEDLMTERINSLNCMNIYTMEGPVDAHLEYQKGEFQIIKETMGTTVDVEFASEKIRQAMMNGESVYSLEESNCYINPDIYSDNRELEHMMREVNRLINVTITYDFEDRFEVVDSARISEWVVFGDDFTYEINHERVKLYMKELGKTYDTFGLPHTFTASSGKTITLSTGDYGWVIDKSESATALIELIYDGRNVTTEPVYRYKAKERGVNDIGDTYIEVSIAQQRMWCYVDGVCIVDTPVVTGLESVEDRATPKDGVWSIDAKMTDYYLVGEDYNSHVDYWLPFNGNVGVHDADWRTEFGGTIYKTNGSHGCVNTPYYEAKKIYENVSIGTPVIVY